MPDNLVIGTSFAAAFGAALVGGVFFGFSNFVMAGLGRTPPEQGVAAMNSINIGDQPGLHDRIVRHRPALSDRRRAVAGVARHAGRSSEERRVGKECARTGRTRWSPYLKKKKQ